MGRKVRDGEMTSIPILSESKPEVACARGVRYIEFMISVEANVETQKDAVLSLKPRIAFSLTSLFRMSEVLLTWTKAKMS